MSAEESDGAAPANNLAIGISFGNSNSSIAYTTGDGKAEVIANEEGDRLIPSMLAYVDGEEFHGTQAKTQLVRNGKNTVSYFRDFLGKDFDSIDPTPCHASAHPQKLDSAIGFSIQDTDTGSENSVTISEITTRHIRRLASSASDFLGKTVNRAVITVPTTFSYEQREALGKAAKNAGVEVLQYISEPLAAVLAYDALPGAEFGDKIIVVADFGGTRSDVAVVASRAGMYSTISTAHDYESGGALLDQVLVDHFAKEFIRKHKTDPRQNAKSLAKLKLEAEATKKALSLGANASLSVESLVDGIDYGSTINRTRYELLANKVFVGFTRLIDEAIQKANLDILDINEVILSGGTSHTPKLAALLTAKFPPTTTIISPSTTSTSLAPSTLAARGAAIQASLVQEFDPEDIQQSTHPMVTVTPHLRYAIGVVLVTEDVHRGVFHPILEAETAVPARRVSFIPVNREGGNVLVKVCEGIREIRVRKPDPAKKEKVNGTNGDDEEGELDDSEEDEEETREKVWKIGNVLAELAVKGVGKGGKVEVAVYVGGDLGVQITAREAGGKYSVRGVVQSSMAEKNVEGNL